MQAKYLFLFRVILASTLALYVGHAPAVFAAGWLIWSCVAAYLLAAAVVLWLGRKGSFPELPLLFSFLLDIAVTSTILYFTEGFQSEFYVAYFLVILSTCFLEKLQFSFIVGAMACLVYSSLAFPGWEEIDTLYLLRTSLLLVTALFSAYVADRARRIERDAAERYASELAWMQRLSTVGRAMAGVLHEVKTPLSTILLSADEAAESAQKRKPVAPLLKSIAREAKKTLSILTDFLDFVRPTELKLKPLELSRPLEKALETVRPHIQNRRIELSVEPAPCARVLGSERHLIQAFTNVMLNAVAAMPMGGKLTVRRRLEHGHVHLEFSDTGVGMTPEVLGRIFEPFFTTKGDAGHGLGLTIVRWIVEKHLGRLDLRSEGPGMGASVDIFLPLL